MSKKRGNQLVFNFSNRVLYTFIAIFLLLIVGVGVYAFSGNVGHTSDQIDEVDPTVGTITNNKWCVGSGGQVVCNQNAPSLFESDTLQSVTDRGASTTQTITVSSLISTGNIKIGSATKLTSFGANCNPGTLRYREVNVGQDGMESFLEICMAHDGFVPGLYKYSTVWALVHNCREQGGTIC